ncbi:MAG TPA: zinc-ribbon domain-containing protein, partial [Pseudonocardia sp.]|uniref:zinc-ribbon domain-containing protein n=1 Tax=Pseudonocardia sp. TaxID=60912 RepID=UPI002BE9AAB5
MFFENTECLRCGQALGFAPEQLAMVPFVEGGATRRCANQALAACNWLVDPATDGQRQLCRSCQLTRTRPDDGDLAALVAFADAESAKRRVVFQLLDLHLPVTSWADQPGGLGYDL